MGDAGVPGREGRAIGWVAAAAVQRWDPVSLPRPLRGGTRGGL